MTNDKIFRILDANINRAMEGIRVAEEVSRFILEERELTLLLKRTRGALKEAAGKLPREELIKSRKALSDVGGKLYTKGERSRRDVRSIFRSNVKRAQEAARVLEEFVKLLDPGLGKEFKAVRFDLYEAEKRGLASLQK